MSGADPLTSPTNPRKSPWPGVKKWPSEWQLAPLRHKMRWQWRQVSQTADVFHSEAKLWKNHLINMNELVAAKLVARLIVPLRMLNSCWCTPARVSAGDMSEHAPPDRLQARDIRARHCTTLHVWRTLSKKQACTSMFQWARWCIRTSPRVCSGPRYRDRWWST